MQPPLPEPWAVDIAGPQKPPSLPHSRRWGWFLIVLWIYSLLVMGGVTLVCFLPTSALSGPSSPTPASPTQQSHDMMLGGFMLLPVLLFLILAAIKNFRR